jgi:formylglycine-generating enzyme required for sulfatase activity
MSRFDLFISYHSPDREAVSTVRELLKARGIESFLDREQLVAGRPWPQALEEALKNVRAVAVFLGHNGLGLWQKREMWFALDRQVQEERAGRAFPVIPVLLPGADLTAGFLFLNTWVDLRQGTGESEALDTLVHAIHGEQVAPAVEIPSKLRPYRGLEVFKEEHAAFFCGREAFIEPLFEAVLKRNLVAVIGPSGSGKSSIVQAGLVPALRRQRPPAATWDVALFTPDDRPYHWLASALMPFLEPHLREADYLAEAEKLGDYLAGGAVKLEATVKRLLEKSNGTDELLLVADQFEELFTLTPEGERQPFVNCLLSALNGTPLTLVITLRADFYGNALNLSRELSNALQQGVINLGPMERDELERAIVEPAHRAELEFDTGLVKRILDDVVSEPGHLPLLEFALTELWERCQGRVMTHSDYDAIGEVEGALTRRADDEFAKLPPAQQKTARRILTQLVSVARPEEGGEDTRKRLGLGELDEEARAVVGKLAEARLLVTGAGGAKEDESSAVVDVVTSSRAERNTVEVAHEALIRGWDRLRQWVDEDRAFLLWQQRLRTQVNDWEARGHRKDVLLRGQPLAEAVKYLDERSGDLTDSEKAFIRSSKKQRRKERRRRAAAVVVTLAVLAYGAWLVHKGLMFRHGWFMLLATFNLAHIEPEMIEIGPKRYDMRFMMGSNKRRDEQPPHEVHIQRPFAIGKYEVSFEEYDRFMLATGRRAEEFPRDQGWGRENRPVINVTSYNAKDYAEWLSEESGKHYRLPTEAEWEYAARAGTEGRYWWCKKTEPSCDIGTGRANCQGCGGEWDGKYRTAPVDAFEPNTWGLYNTAGNVWEWVQDCYHDNYEGAPKDGLAWEPSTGECGRRVVRGGSWDDRPQDLRSAARDRNYPGGRYSNVGFRLAQDY